MQLSDLIGAIVNVLAVFGAVGAAYYRLKSKVDAAVVEIERLRSEIHENGFVRIREMEDAWKTADEIHKRHDESINRLEAEVVRLRQS